MRPLKHASRIAYGRRSPASPQPGELLAPNIETQEFCIDVMSVRKSRGWTPPTALPHTPPHVRGSVNFRGTVLPIVDLAARLGFSPTKTKERSVTIVTETGSQVAGLTTRRRELTLRDVN